MLKHARTHTHTYTHTHTHTHTGTHTHSRCSSTHTRTHTHTYTETKPACTLLIQGPESSDPQSAHPTPNGHGRLGQRLRSSRSFQALLSVWTHAFKGAGGQRGSAAGNPLHVLWENKAACTKGALNRGLCCGFCLQVPSLFSCISYSFLCFGFCLQVLCCLSSSFRIPSETCVLPIPPSYASSPLFLCTSEEHCYNTDARALACSRPLNPYPSPLSFAPDPYPSPLSFAPVPYPSSLSFAPDPYPSSLSPPPAQGRRATMEDTYSLFPADGLLHDAALGGKWRLYGLFDGHGGARCSTFCQQTLLPMVAELLTAGQCVRERVCVCARTHAHMCVHACVTRGFRCPHQSRTAKS